MFALSVALVVAASPLAAPPVLSVEGRSARILDETTLAKLAALDLREAALQPSSAQRTFKTLGIISASLALIPVAAMAVGLVVGIVVGAASYGFVGGLVGMFLGVWAVMSFIPLPVWLAAAALGVVSGVCFVNERVHGEGQRGDLSAIRAERRALLHPTPLSTVATF